MQEVRSAAGSSARAGDLVTEQQWSTKHAFIWEPQTLPDRPTARIAHRVEEGMRRTAVAVLVASLAVAGCTHPTPTAPSGPGATRPTRAAALTPSTQPPLTLSIRGRSTRPSGWKPVGYRGLSLFVPATWRVRDGRRFPCPGMLAGPAVVLGHSDFIPPCPMPRLRTPLLWIDNRRDDQLPATAVPTRINGLAVRLLRLGPDNLQQASSDELLYWSQYPGARGFRSGPCSKG
jgi:hypothetical protein